MNKFAIQHPTAFCSLTSASLRLVLWTTVYATTFNTLSQTSRLIFHVVKGQHFHPQLCILALEIVPERQKGTDWYPTDLPSLY